MAAARRETRYLPSGPAYGTAPALFGHTAMMLREIAEGRELAWRFFLRDFNARYRQSFLGAAWAVVMPVLAVGLFMLLNRSGLLAIGRVSVPYAAHALVGLTLWNLFAGSVTSATGSLVGAGTVITRIDFPKIALVLASTGQALVHFAISAAVSGLAFLYYGIAPSWAGLLLALACVLPLYLLALALGLVLALANAIARDVSHAVGIALNGFLLITPVLYPIGPETFLGRFNAWNPVNFLLNAARDCLVSGAPGDPGGLAWSAAFSAAFFLLAWRFFYFGQRRIVERI